MWPENSDVEAGLRIGIRTYLVETGYGHAERNGTSADFVVSDLAAAINHLLSFNAPNPTDPPTLEPLRGAAAGA